MTLAAAQFTVCPLRLGRNPSVNISCSIPNPKMDQELLNFGQTPCLLFYSITKAKPTDFWETELPVYNPS